MIRGLDWLEKMPRAERAEASPSPSARGLCHVGGGAGQSLSFALRVMVEAVLVEEFAGEGTDRRVETPRSAEKEASIGWNGVVLAEQVLESRGGAAPRMATLDGLLEPFLRKRGWWGEADRRRA